MKSTPLLTLVALLAGCAEATSPDAESADLNWVDPASDTVDADEPILSDDEPRVTTEMLPDEAFELDWDDPDAMPEVDRDSIYAEQLSLSTGTVSVGSAYYGKIRGEISSDQVGICVADLGDLNADGKNEIGIGSTYGSTNEGGAYMYKAPFTAGTYNIGTAKGRWYGASGQTSKAGQVVAGGGELNGDATGYHDWIFGAQQDDTAKTNAGAAYIVLDYGRAKNTLPSGAIQLTGINANDRAGAGVDIIGDLNADGYDDVLVGAINRDANGTDSGSVYLVYGPITANESLSAADGEVAGEVAGDAVGSRVISIGDFDGDGLADWAAGARANDTIGTDAGAVYVITDSTALPTNFGSADLILRGNAASEAAGNQLVAAGDVDGDGNADLLVGALGYSGKGGAWLISSGRASGKLNASYDWRGVGSTSGDQFGSSLAASDVNGDGQIDMIVGANRQSSDDRGAVYVFLGPVSGSENATAADTKITGEAAGDYLGSWIAVVPNSTPLAYAEDDTLAIGASAHASDNRGAVYLIAVN